jgi:integrase
MHWDTLLPAFGVRVGKTKRTFLVIHSGGRRISLGHHGAISLAQARDKARTLMQGGNLRPGSFPDVLEAYTRHLKKNRRASHSYETERLLRKHFRISKPLSAVTKTDIVALLDQIESRSITNHAVMAIKGFFSWAEANAYLQTNPISKLKKPYAEHSRSRTLTDDELKRVWTASKQLGDFGVIVRLCVLTGQRRGEISSISQLTITSNSVEFPPILTKNKRPHTIPLTENSIKLAKQLQHPCRAWSKPKKKLDELSGATAWTLHDLRRTFSTLLAQLKTPPHIIERLLNHSSGEISGVAAIYNRHQYLPEMRQAVEAYEKHLETIIREPLS